jgi:hypothetical protein
MLAHQPSVLPQFDPLGIRTDLHRPPNRMGRHRVAVVVEADETGLRHRGRHCVEAVEAAGIANQTCPLRLEHLPDRLFAHFGMAMRSCVGDALVNQPGVQLRVALRPHSRCEEPLAHQPDLVLNLALSHPDAGVQATGSTS